MVDLERVMAEYLINWLERNLAAFVETAGFALSDYINSPIAGNLGLLNILLVAYVVWTSIKLVMGQIELSKSELFQRIGVVVVVIAVVSAPQYFFNLFFFAIPDVITSTAANTLGFIRADDAVGIFNRLDELTDTMVGYGLEYIQENSEISNLGLMALPGYLLVLAAYVLFAIILGLYAITRIMIAIMVVLLPLFMLGLLFESTRSSALSWLKVYLTYLMVSVLLFALVSFIYVILLELNRGYVKSNQFTIDLLFQMLAVYVLAYMAGSQVNNIAATIGGSNSYGMGSVMGSSGRVAQWLLLSGGVKLGSAARRGLTKGRSFARKAYRKQAGI